MKLKLALGTVQLGMNYGLANSTGRPGLQTAKDILEVSLKGGIQWLDTAIAYGDSEGVVGKCLKMINPELANQGKIITKLPALNKYSLEELDHLLDSSRRHLERESVDGLLLHDASDLYNAPAEKLEHFCGYKKNGKAKRLGVSVYTVEQAEYAINNFDIDIIQVPSNLFDRSFLDAGFFSKCKKLKVEVFVRSIFLQGLFFLKKDDPRLAKIADAPKAVEILHEFCREHGCSVAELCFADATRFTNAKIIIGAELPAQVTENIKMSERAFESSSLLEDWDRIRPVTSETLTDPSRWPSNK